ncbi:hypothetical protein MTR67_038034 [Solanum verrucosum]|uniref:CHY-type domain-containing protein n=1 Tax=Solanum verrucosum TaxID=315347 RepID=A0AAF0UF05_SOLVR|nr:hypothetical protein MTR67_038034 [Solanum verrucosum]
MECSLKEHITTLSFAAYESVTEMGSGNYGCSHYRRRCKIRAPCCDEIFDCRHCHNDSKNSLDVDPLKRHDIPRHDIKRKNKEVRKIERIRSFALCVILNRMFNKNASNAGFAWGSTFAQNATSSMMMYSCPVCSRSYCDMSRVWEQLDQEVASTAMPEMYQDKKVWILCNDCAETSEVNFHIVAHKCPSCKSYNTRQTRGGSSSCSNITDMIR